MHKFLIRASQLTFSLFSPGHWSGLRARHTNTHTICKAPHSMRRVSPWHPDLATQLAHRPEDQTPHSNAVVVPQIQTVRAMRPVRVLRRREGTAERLVIVGRMADVCAELDRLVAHEHLCG